MPSSTHDDKIFLSDTFFRLLKSGEECRLPILEAATDRPTTKVDSTMTACHQQRSASMRALVVLVALTGACAFQMPR
jgi:hypothetical protein